MNQPTDDQPEQLTPLALRRKQPLADDIWLFEFVHPDGTPLPPYQPGSHITIQTPSGARRHYSLCDDGVEPDCYAVAIKGEQNGRGASLSMVKDAREGDQLPVSAPDNSFPLDDSEELLFIAGGIGITPIMSMMRRLRREGHDNFKLIYCTRDAESTAFLGELGDDYYLERVVVHHDGGDPDQVYDLWPLFETPGKQLVYCCGPAPMMDEVRDMTGHWPSGAIRFEDFGSDVEALRDDDTPFQVRHADTGEVVEIPFDATILDTLRGLGHDLRSSCESGTCGTCKTELVEGEADHRDIVLDDREKDERIMICVSRAKSDELVLRW